MPFGVDGTDDLGYLLVNRFCEICSKFVCQLKKFVINVTYLSCLNVTLAECLDR